MGRDDLSLHAGTSQVLRRRGDKRWDRRAEQIRRDTCQTQTREEDAGTDRRGTLAGTTVSASTQQELTPMWLSITVRGTESRPESFNPPGYPGARLSIPLTLTPTTRADLLAGLAIDERLLAALTDAGSARH
jgi:hypothetical protein